MAEVRGSYNVIYIEETDDGLNASYSFIENAIKTGALIFTRHIGYNGDTVTQYGINLVVSAAVGGDDAAPEYAVSILSLYDGDVRTYTASDKNSNLVFAEP